MDNRNFRSPWRVLAAVTALTCVWLTASIGLGQDGTMSNQTLPMLSLRDCIGIAVDSSPTLLISDQRMEIASQGVKDAYGAFLPSVSLNRTWQKSRRTDFDDDQYEYSTDEFQTTDSAGDTTDWARQVQILSGQADTKINSTYSDWGGGLDLNLFDGFTMFSNLSGAKNSMKAAEATRQYTRELVIENVITSYFNLLRSQKLAGVAVETRDQAAKELERTETYFRLGSAAKSDVLQQKVRLENTKLDLVVANNSVNKAFADLAFAMNRPMASPFRVDTSVLDTDFHVEEIQTLYTEAQAKRLDLVSNEYNVKASNNEVTSATGSLYPQINLFANYSRSDNESPYKFGSQLSESTSFGYRINWNVFDRFRTWTNRGRAKANARIAQYELDQARMNVEVEIRQLHNNLLEASERSVVSRETIKQSQEELRLAQERFRVGAGTALDVIVAQVNLASARAQDVRAICDFMVAKAQITRATGRLTAMVEQQP